MKSFFTGLCLFFFLSVASQAATFYLFDTSGAPGTYTLTATNIPYVPVTNWINETNLVAETNFVTETNLVTITNVVVTTNSTEEPVDNEITNSLVVWYPLAGNLNDNWSGDNASSIQSPVWTDGVLGNPDMALYFSGGQGLTADDSILPMSNTPRTISFWLYATQLPAPGEVALLFEYGNLSGGDFMNCYLQNSSGTNFLQIYAGADGNGAVLFPFTPPLNQWVNLTVEIDSNNTFSFYENGALINFEILHPPQTAPGGTLYIGYWNNSGYINGAMADFRIYNAALSQAQLMTNFLAVDTSTTILPDLLYLKMQDDINATPAYSYINWPAPLADSSGNNNIAATNYDPDTPDMDIWATNVVPDNAMHFHGVSASYIDTHDTTDFAFTNQNYTINVWVYPYTASGVFLACGIENINGWAIYQDNSYNTYFGIYTNGTAYAIGGSNAKANNNGWNDICVTVEGGTNESLYFNGGLAYSGVANQALTSEGNSLLLGRQVTGSGSYNSLDGNLWQPQVWSTNLSPNDVSKLYYQQKNGTPWP